MLRFCVAGVTFSNPARCGDYVFALLGMYIYGIDPNIFECFSVDESKFALFSHIPNHLTIYYLGNCRKYGIFNCRNKRNDNL
ncbi:unnamed protein product [Rhizophagus irregularis]|nr:unnamed protein product [Rhizophagus irregularis]